LTLVFPQNQIYLGSESYVQKLQEKIDKGKDLSEIPKSQKRPKPKKLQQYEKKAGNRNQAILLSYASGGYSMKEIGDYYGIHYSRISRIIKNRRRQKTRLDPCLSAQLVNLKSLRPLLLF
jgi:putative transposase